MFIKNNSNIRWENYNLGSFKITIEPKSTFEIDEGNGVLLLRLLGCDAWLVKVSATEKIEEKIEEKVEAPKKKGRKSNK